MMASALAENRPGWSQCWLAPRGCQLNADQQENFSEFGGWPSPNEYGIVLGLI